MKCPSNVLIFGATSEIAMHFARIVVSNGASVYCIGRNPKKLNFLLDDLKVRAGKDQKILGDIADLANIDLHSDLIDKAFRSLVNVDAILIAHGTLPDQKKCEEDNSYGLHEINNNGISTISLLNLVSKKLEFQRFGTIAVISSVAGDRGRQSNYFYGAAKGMVSIYLQGLRNRLHSKNVNILTVKPGFVNTPMTKHIRRKNFLWSEPELVAKGIVKGILRGRNIVYLPGYWFFIMLVIKLIPENIFKKLRF